MENELSDEELEEISLFLLRGDEAPETYGADTLRQIRSYLMAVIDAIDRTLERR